MANILLISLFPFLHTNVFAQPDSAAVDPPVRQSADVISIYSDSYANISSTNYNPGWGQNTAFNFEEISGNETIKFSNFNYQGFELSGSVDVSGMEFLHVDVWTEDATAFDLYLISPGPAETPSSLAITTGQWVSYDIPVSDFATVVDLSNVFQFKFTDGGAGNAPTIYLDNLYFYKSPTDSSLDATLSDLKVNGETIEGFSPNTFNYLLKLASTETEVPTISVTTSNEHATYSINPSEELPGSTTIEVSSQNGENNTTYSVTFELVEKPQAAAPTPPSRDESSVISIYSDSYSNISGTNYSPAWGQSTSFSTETIDGNESLKYENLNYQGIELSGAQDISDMDYVHLDLWTSNAATLRLFLISPGPAETSVTLPIVANVWKGYDIPLSSFSSVVDLANFYQFKFDDGSLGGSPTFYIDNIYFYKGGKAASYDATLSSILVDEEPIPNFSSSIFQYEVALSSGIANAPTITATTSDHNALAEVTQADEIPGEATVLVTAEDGTSTKSYTVNFTVSTPTSDASLASLSIDGDLLDNFTPTNYSYSIELENGATIPNVVATASFDSAHVQVFPPTTLPGTTTIKVTSQDSTSMQVYTVFFKTTDLLWWDEFSANVVDEEVWQYDLGDGCSSEICGWGNAELQIYQKDNVKIEEIPEEPGNYALVIEAERETNGGSQFTSGRIKSEGKLDFRYGILEVRMKVPDLKTGLWPALWMLGSNNNEVGWPQSGEIDVMEMGQKSAFRTQQGFPNSTENEYVGGNVIWYTSAACSDGNPTCSAAIAGDANYNTPYVSGSPMNDRFQIYRLYWNQNQLRMTVEDQGTEHDLYSAPFEFNNSDLQSTFRKPFYLLLNMAVGGNFTDATTNSQVSAPLPAKMYVDYVRIKEYNGAGEIYYNGVLSSNEEESTLESPTDFKLLQNYPNPFNPNTIISYQLPQNSSVSVTVFDLTGRMVSTLVNEYQTTGSHQVNFNASELASGVYLYRLSIDGAIVATKKMVLLK